MNAGRVVCAVVFLCKAWVFAQTEVCDSISNENEIWLRLHQSYFLNCGSSFSSYYWWKSKECASFTQHYGCSGSGCQITHDDYVSGFFYYCCTESNVMPDQAAEDKRICFKVSVCTEVNSSYIQEYVIFGTSGTAYVELSAQSTPEEQVTSFIMEEESVDFTTDVRGASPFYSYIHTFEVPDVANGTVMELIITYSTSSTCHTPPTYTTVQGYITVIRELGQPRIEPAGCTSDTVSNTLMVQSPSPSLVGESCSCQTEGFRDSDVVLCLLGFLLFLSVCVIGGLTVCVIYQRRSNHPSDPHKGPNPYCTVQLRRMNSNGSTVPFAVDTPTPLSISERPFPPVPNSSPPSYDGDPQYATLNSPNNGYGMIHRLPPQQQGQRIALV